MSKLLLIPEVLTKVHNVQSDVDKKKILKLNETPGLLHILRVAFTPEITFTCGAPEYVASNLPVGLGHTSLQTEARRIELFAASNVSIPDHRKRELLLYLLSGLHASEAVLLKMVILGTLNINGLTAELVNETFPGLLDWEGKKWTPKIALGSSTQTSVTEDLDSKVSPSILPRLEPAKNATKSGTKPKQASRSKKATS